MRSFQHLATIYYTLLANVIIQLLILHVNTFWYDIHFGSEFDFKRSLEI